MVVVGLAAIRDPRGKFLLRRDKRTFPRYLVSIFKNLYFESTQSSAAIRITRQADSRLYLRGRRVHDISETYCRIKVNGRPGENKR